MNNNCDDGFRGDDGFRDNVEYISQGEQPSGQILTPKAVIEASEDLREYRQIVNAELMKRGCDSWLISIKCNLNVEALNQLVDEIKGAGWHVALEDKTLNIN